MSAYRIGKDVLLLAGLRAAMLVLTLIGRELPLTRAERQAVVERVQAALLAPAEV